ncbi:MAG: efflux transporter outer membrane subunit [Jhaorihella sp.]
MAGNGRRTALPRMLCIAMSVAVAGCDVAPAFKAPGFPFAASFASHPAGAPALLENTDWWRKFDDPVLDGLVEAALAGNLDLAAAGERVREAEALARTVPEPATLTGEAGAGRRGGRAVADADGGKADLGFEWLFDPYGERRAELRAAGGRVEIADAELDAARLLLLSGIVTAYVDLRFQQRSLQLRRAELGSRQETLEQVRRLEAASAATRLDIVRAEALVSETRSLIPGHEAAIRVQQNRIAVLLGQTPGRALAGPGRGQPLAGMPADIGIPADLLRNRPDIRIAERLYYVAVAEVGAETARLYPKLSLSGEISLSSFGGTTGMDYFFGPTLRLPALPDGSRRAGVAARQSRARQALTAWQSAVLEAIGEVESALVEYSASLSSVGAARKTVRLYGEAVDLTRQLIGRDGATVSDLLDAEQSVAAANILLAQNLRALGRDFVALNVSLGSGSGYQ